MDDLISLLLIGGIVGVIGIFAYYVVRTYLIPKRVEELAEMIRQGHVGPAISKLNKMIEENDRDPYLHFLLGEAYSKQNDLQAAATEYKQVIKIGKWNPQVKEVSVRSRLAKIYMQNRNYDEAKKEYLILTRLDGTNHENYYQAGILFETAGLVDKALPYFKQSAKLKPTHADSFLHIGTAEYHFGNLSDAKLALTEAVKLNSNLHSAHYYLGMCLKNQKDYDWAVKEFDLAAKDENLKGRALLAKGLSLMEKGQLPTAQIELEKGLLVAPKGGDLELNIRYAIAACAERKRDFHTAISNWERIIDVNAKFRDVQDKLKAYDEFRTDDTIKDFMIAPPGKFEAQTRAIVEAMTYKVVDLTVIDDSEVHILATEEEGNRRTSKKSNRLIYILRTTDLVPERIVRTLHEEMRSKGANKGVCISTSDFSSQAHAFIQSRPIELYDRKQLIAL
ncbi:MAG TPA: tetratricopeptide repeat protein, partial [Turneriella sp.]|nr:tetratricopeptide repeat protein [Turneriella sp.]